MNETKELLTKAISIMDERPATALLMIKKAIKQVEKHTQEKNEEWLTEMMKPEVLIGKVF